MLLCYYYVAVYIYYIKNIDLFKKVIQIILNTILGGRGGGACSVVTNS